MVRISKKLECSIAGCSNPTRARGWCNKHYSRWVTKGDVNYEPKTYPKVCTFDGCGLPHRGLGFCSTHKRHFKEGRELRPRGYGKSPEERFWKKVRYSPFCWQWEASTTAEGYGIFESYSYGTASAHRISYMLLVGTIPEGLHIDHICHNPSCVNPLHLRAVTPRENQQNRKGLPTNNTSGHLGVYWSKSNSKWFACIKHKGVKYRSGSFADKSDAIAYADRLYEEFYPFRSII